MKKQALVNRALKRIGVNTRFSEADGQESQDALETLEDLMAGNSGLGIRIGWNSEDEPNGETEAGIPEWSHRGVIALLGVELCAYFEKDPTMALVKAARQGMNTIVARTAQALPVQYPRRMPRGQGNQINHNSKYFNDPTYIQTDTDFLTDNDGEPITE